MKVVTCCSASDNDVPLTPSLTIGDSSTVIKYFRQFFKMDTSWYLTLLMESFFSSGLNGIFCNWKFFISTYQRDYLYSNKWNYVLDRFVKASSLNPSTLGILNKIVWNLWNWTIVRFVHLAFINVLINFTDATNCVSRKIIDSGRRTLWFVTFFFRENAFVEFSNSSTFLHVVGLAIRERYLWNCSEWST